MNKPKFIESQDHYLGFHEAVKSWFEKSIGQPTHEQKLAWPKIRQRKNVLITAPTGSGKTLAAFLGCINDLVLESLQYGSLPNETRILYVSPLRALSNDIEKNLELPLNGINTALEEQGLPLHTIRSAVRTGDTSQWQRRLINKTPPHILVTTPESLYLLLTSDSGRKVLSGISTVIIDEIHALIGSKRGAHLCLSLQRLKALIGHDFQRIGLSATVNKRTFASQYLTAGEDCEIISAPTHRKRDIEICLPKDDLSAVMSNEVWEQLYDQLTKLCHQHSSTLIFVNTRKLAERLAHHLSKRFDERLITTHHGSLSRAHRIDAEQRLKQGKLKVLVATASLELGIDIGDVDLVCQIGSVKLISTLLQRIGRSGHGIDRIPKGRVFPTTLEELVESVALINAINKGKLDDIIAINKPMDVLAQQIVAEASARKCNVTQLYDCFSQAMPYKELSFDEFNDVINTLVFGFTNRRGIKFAYLHLDAVNNLVRARRGARLTALTNGGAIPELFDYDVILNSEQIRVGSVNEDFAFESMAGDIFQLGNTSYRIIRVTSGKVFVEDAKGLPPSIPFWLGEAPGRSDELSLQIDYIMRFCRELYDTKCDNPIKKIIEEFTLDSQTGEMIHSYLYTAYQNLNSLPSLNKIIFERFFDENDDMHLLIHSIYGSRLNRAWGLALRKRFCRKFNFELQAAALDSSIILSLGATHSFDLAEVLGYLSPETVENVLIQALLDVPLFNTHWRWVCNIALAVPRNRAGKRLPAQIQRNNAEDLVAQVFPDQLACLENIQGEREIPNHPLINQTLDDCLNEVMDVKGLINLLGKIKNKQIDVEFADVSTPSVLSQAIINARAYAFLDEAPAEERRTLAINTTIYGESDDIYAYGQIPRAALDQLYREIKPIIRDVEELHEALFSYGLMRIDELENAQHVATLMHLLIEQGRAYELQLATSRFYYCPEFSEVLSYLYPNQVDTIGLSYKHNFFDSVNDCDSARVELVRFQLELLGPIAANELAIRLTIPTIKIEQALLTLRQEGFVMHSENIIKDKSLWCERRLLARLHRYALQGSRQSITSIDINSYRSFLNEWQHNSPQTKGRGLDALLAVIDKLQGYRIPISKWKKIISMRMSEFDSQQLDLLFLSGQLVWYRPSSSHVEGKRIAGLKRNSAIMIFNRQKVAQLMLTVPNTIADLSSSANHVYQLLIKQQDMFFDDILSRSSLLKSQLENALCELVDAGLLRSDSFMSLLKMVNKKTKPVILARRRIARINPYAGRWRALIPSDEIELTLEEKDQQLKAYCTILLQRYGVVCYSMMAKESGFASWRDLMYMFKRMEARGQIVGGRFITGLAGEQFALKEVIPLLNIKRKSNEFIPQKIEKCDPLSLFAEDLIDKTDIISEINL